MCSFLLSPLQVTQIEVQIHFADPIFSLASVAGTQEPEYGPDSIQSVAKQTEAVRFTEMTKEHLRWKAYQYTNVETQTFYITADNGALVMIQVIYSNIV